jgi:hypothetical protein
VYQAVSPAHRLYFYVQETVCSAIESGSMAGMRARKETDRLCFDNEAGGRDGKAER